MQKSWLYDIDGCGSRFAKGDDANNRLYLAIGVIRPLVLIATIAAGLFLSERLAAACDTCGCGTTEEAVCTPHSHSDGGATHSHGGAPVAATGSGTGVTSSYYQWDVPTTPNPGTMRFTVLGDTQGLSVLDQLVVDMNAYNSEFFVLPGDLVNTGGSGSWDSWIAKADNFNGERYMVPGNHDLPVGGDALWQSKFSWLPDSQMVDGKQGIDQMDYFFDKGDTRFISVTTDSQANGTHRQPAALEWLTAVLNDPVTQSKEHVFVYSHHPVTYQNESGTGGTAGAWWQTMADSGVVDAFFAGHWHLFQPSQPDPNSLTWEATLGTGGGSLEGYPWQQQHGYTLIDVTGPRVEATFFGDADGDGAFDDILDQFVITDSVPKPKGLVAYYSFNFGTSNLDTATSVLAKQNHGRYVEDATTISGGVLGKALSVDGVGDFADGGSVGDYTMALLGDMTISLYANFDNLAPGTNQNTLVSYSGRIPTIGGGGVYGPQESTNHPYYLNIRDDKRLQIMWEHDDAAQVVLTSTAAASAGAGQWHHYMVVRDTQSMVVRFYVDGVQLGDAVSFSQLPTGGANGFLHIGNGIDGNTGFDGAIDELTIYDDVLLPSQVFIGPLPGDLDENGMVNLADFTVNFLTNFGATVGSPGDLATLAMGDLDLDGDVDLFDFDAFQGAYLDANPGAAALSLTIPEPGGLLLIVVGSFFLLTFRGRQWRLGRCGLAVAVVLLIAPVAHAASLIRDYQLSGNLNDALGGPALVDSGGALRTNGYSFVGGGGLSLSNWDPTNLGADYSIELYAQFDVFGNGSWGKLVDFKNRGADTGFYIHNTGGHRLEFFNHSNPGPDTLTQGEFHHVVISRDEPGAGDVNVWLDGNQQWTFDDDSGELAVANAANNILHFFVDDSGSENPAGYVDFIRIYDSGVTQAEVNTMVAGLPQYGALEITVNKITGTIDISNDFPELLGMRGYQLTSASGELDVLGWVSWDDAGLDGDTWFEANPSATQLAELNLTSSGVIPLGGSRSFGAAYGGGQSGNEDLVFQYLELGSATPIAIPITYQGSPTPGDLNEDGEITIADWLEFQARAAVDLTGLTPEEALLQGDMDLNGQHGLPDYVLFRQAFEQAQGSGSFAALQTAVPEPSTSASLACLGVSLAWSRWREQRTGCWKPG